MNEADRCTQMQNWKKAVSKSKNWIKDVDGANAAAVSSPPPTVTKPASTSCCRGAATTGKGCPMACLGKTVALVGLGVALGFALARTQK